MANADPDPRNAPNAPAAATPSTPAAIAPRRVTGPQNARFSAGEGAQSHTSSVRSELGEGVFTLVTLTTPATF